MKRPELEDYDQIAFLDVEASGLHPGSFPIEIGWARPDFNVTAASSLIRPADGWTRDLWDPEAEKIHGLTFDQCKAEGADPLDVANRLNEALRGSVVYSDAVSWDTYWVQRLFDAAGIDRQFPIEHCIEIFGAALKRRFPDEPDYVGLAEYCYARVGAYFPKPHRAEPDARFLAATYRFMLDPTFANEMPFRFSSVPAAAG